MNAETFCEHFATFADAPNGVDKLRAMILHLAVQGRIAPQEVGDESAQTLIESIVQQKADLVREKKVRNSNAHTSRNAWKDSYALPQGWSWVTLDTITEIGTGGTPPTGTKEYYHEGTIPWITSSATNSEFISNPDQFITQRAVEDCGLKIYPAGSLVVALYGQGKTRGQVGQLMFDSTSNQACAVIRFFGDGLSIRDYVRLFLRKMYHELRDLAAGGAQPNLNGGMIRLLRVPLPPIAEQRRIVEKVDQLLGLCDELAARQAAQREKRQRLVGATLDRLFSTRNPAEFPTHAHRLRNHFDQLFNTPTTIPQLRQTILQLAVQGQLVPQDPREESAESLLLDLLNAKVDLVEKTGINNTSNGSVITDAETPFPLPTEWRWTRLGDYGVLIGGGTPSKQNAEFWVGDIPWVSPKDMKRRFIEDVTDHISPAAIDESSAKLIPTGSLLMVVRGMILAHSFPVALTKREVTINQDMKSLQIAKPELAEWLLFVCEASRDRMLAKVQRSGHGTCRIESESVTEFLIPLPPLAEQKRIVTKVTELLSLCDGLEAKLTQAESASTQLLTAAIHHLLETRQSTCDIR